MPSSSASSISSNTTYEALPILALSASAIISVMLCIIESTVFEVFLLKDDEVNIVPWLGSTVLHLMLY